MSADVSVVIATRDRAPLLAGCLTSLASQDGAGRFEVVVVDNGSRDDTPAVIAAAGAIAVRVEEPNRARARNAGIARASAPTLIFIDDDTIAPPRFVAAHAAAHTRPGRVVSGPILNVTSPAQRPRPSPLHYSRAFFCTCNASAPRADLLAIGGFDERFDRYGWEDTDVGVRLNARGLRRTFAWSAYIYHVKPPEVMPLERRLAIAREKGAMAARFVRKSPTLPVKLATGAYGANFARASLAATGPMRRIFERMADAHAPALAAWGAGALADAAYVDALRDGLRDGA